MKLIIVIVFIFSLIVVAEKKAALDLNIPEMDCIKCFNLIKKSLLNKYKDLTFEFDFDNRNLIIFSDEIISKNVVINEIQQLGYTVNPSLLNKISVKVDGIVCSFCLIGIKKNFEQFDHVVSAEFNLNSGFLELTLEPNKTISDNVINQIFFDAGYNVNLIKR